jgi:hypothetical protein
MPLSWKLALGRYGKVCRFPSTIAVSRLGLMQTRSVARFAKRCATPLVIDRGQSPDELPDPCDTIGEGFKVSSRLSPSCRLGRNSS